MTVLSTTSSLCTTCKRLVPAELVEVDGAVELQKACPDHGAESVRIADSARWYRETLAAGAVLTPPADPRPTANGCPFDCGPCTQHRQRVELTIVPITSGCNLACPICYTHNRNEGAYHMAEAELQGILDVLARRDPSRRIINLTGGEPTVHPHFKRLVQLCHDNDVRRITISTHGLGLDDETLTLLASLDARVVLSFDSFDDATNQAMLGGKFTGGKTRALRRLGEFGVKTTLLPVIAKGFNDHELGRLVDLALSSDHVRSLELHTMTFTGQYGGSFEPRGRITPDGVLTRIEAQTDGRIRMDDFVPAPAAHSLCYQVCYMLQLVDGSWLPMARFLGREELRGMLAGSLYLEPSAEVEQRMTDWITRAWAEGLDPILAETLKRFIDSVYAPGIARAERLDRSEKLAKAIYIHSHMDEKTFDTDRIQQCCVGITAPDGTNVPSCAYNVLYRNRDSRFTPHPQPPVDTLGRGAFPAMEET